MGAGTATAAVRTERPLELGYLPGQQGRPAGLAGPLLRRVHVANQTKRSTCRSSVLKESRVLSMMSVPRMISRVPLSGPAEGCWSAWMEERGDRARKIFRRTCRGLGERVCVQVERTSYIGMRIDRKMAPDRHLILAQALGGRERSCMSSDPRSGIG